MPVESVTVAGFPALAATNGRGARPRPPIVLLHGAFSHGEHFGPWLEYLSARGFAAVAPTLRVPGTSVARLRFEHYFRAAWDVVSAVAESSPLPVVIGHSMGGLIAQKLAESGRCGAAVLVAPAPSGMLTAQLRSLPYLLPMFPRILAGLELRPTDRTLRALVLHHIAEPDRTALLRSFVPESGTVYREMILGLVRVEAARVRCPVLCVGGTDDRIVSLRLLRTTARALHAEVKPYAGRGHWILAEPGWQGLIEDVIAWLERQGPPSEQQEGSPRARFSG